MLQTLVLVATLVVLSAAVLTSTLVSAKTSFHALVVAKTQTAMNDATSDFVSWAQKFVAANGTEADWSSAPEQHLPTLKAMCVDSAPKCPFAQTEHWTVTGVTAGKAQAQRAGQPADASAMNMAPAIDEQRISATISVNVSDATGRTSYGGKTEQVTARILDAAPYVVITGTHDLSAAVGSTRAVEGDSGGATGMDFSYTASAPSVLQPSAYANTVIRTTVDCLNTPGFDQINLFSAHDIGMLLIDPNYRPGGSLVWAYQMPCSPAGGVPPAPEDAINYESPAGQTYKIDASSSTTAWEKGDGIISTFLR